MDALLANINSDNGADLTSQRDALIAQYNQVGSGMVLYRIADDNARNTLEIPAHIIKDTGVGNPTASALHESENATVKEAVQNIQTVCSRC